MSRIVLVGDAPALAERLRAGGFDHVVVPALTDDALDRADIVAFAGVPATPMAADAVWAAVAGRLVVVPRAEPTRGFIPGADHLDYEDDEECVRVLAAAVAFPDAYRPIAVFGRLTARAVSRCPVTPARSGGE